MRTMLIGAVLVGFSMAGAARAQSPTEFLKDAIQGDNSEMRLGGLAAQRGGSAAIRSYGRTLRTDHMTAKAQAVAVARTFRMAPPSEMMPEAREEYRKLERMRGRGFDREFAHYMVSDHQQDIAKFEQEARSGDRRTAALARRQLPVLRKHLRIARNLAS